MDRHYIYLIACKGETKTYVKIGLTSSIQRRLSNIQTGCPHPIAHAFVVRSEYREEVKGLEKLLHMLLEPARLRAEWYEGTTSFFEMLDAVLSRIKAVNVNNRERWTPLVLAVERRRLQLITGRSKWRVRNERRAGSGRLFALSIKPES